MNVKKTTNNVLWGLLSNIVIISLGLIVPRIILINYGSDTNGYTSTVRQIFTYMALLEAGIGQSTLNSLYDPVLKQDKARISSILVASRNYYRKVTYFYAALVVVMAILIPFILKTEIGFWTAFGVVIFEGASAVIGFYYLESWKQLLSADGYYYVIQNITMIITILSYGIKILLTSFGLNIAIVQLGFFLLSLVQMAIYKIYTKKHYAWVDFKAVPNNEALKDRYSFMLSQVASTVFSSTDIIVISIICGTVISSVYSIYGLIYNNLNSCLNAAYFGTVFLLGQMWKKDKKEYTILHDAFDGISMCAITATMSVAYILTIPFISIYTKGVEDVNYIYPLLPLLFSLVQLFSWSRYVNGNLTAIAGYAKPVSKISAIEAIINLSFTILLSIKFGIMGALFATVIALPLKIIYCLFLANHTILKRTVWKSLGILIINYVLFGTSIVFNAYIKIPIKGMKDFILFAILLCIVVYPLYFIVNCLFNKSLRIYVGKLISKIEKRLIRR